jgi:hypothetical protein
LRKGRERGRENERERERRREERNGCSTQTEEIHEIQTLRDSERLSETVCVGGREGGRKEGREILCR